ncbi:hypothetical protein [Qipengyuania zhejiangensis]|uniref:hypothetical protein n=1 Tax=Qipengyuania zhejiangensis TaxID=3077782 RepID=UPI002D770E66|nr:hypothetical protein [Qipengyuania sp. Z2]
MVKTLDNSHPASKAGEAGTRDWRKAMSDNVAIALLVYTGLQIFVTVQAMKVGLTSTAPYFILIILVVAIIPFCRKFEHRWTAVPEDHAHDPQLASAFRRDQVTLWVLAIGVPFLLTGFFRLIFA